MKIVFSVFGTRGDVAPVIAVAKELLRRGHRVLVCGPPGRESLAGDLPYRPTGPGEAALAALAEARVPPGRMPAHLLAFIETEVTAGLEALLASEADLIVGAGLPLAASSAAEALGRPYRYLAYSPLVMPSQQWPPLMLPLRVPRWSHALAWLGQSLGAGLFSRPLDRQRAALGLGPIGDFWGRIFGLEARPVLAADRAILRLPESIEPRFAISAPALLRAEAALSPATEAFLQAGPAPLYLGFGSMGGQQAQFSEWLDLLARRGLRALVALPPGQRAVLPSHMLAVGPEPHHLLFERCSLVLHHGGAGTVANAARAGVPQIITGFGGDQFYWGECLARLGVAPPPLSARHLTRAGLWQALGQALSRRARQQSRELAERLRQADREADGASLTADLLLQTQL